ncbi:metallophosphoesterase family protein [Pseudooceanicola nanhaiensis]|uniref:metallophosphoesterase family protein n=1 Tax=Pseudooceanicola nanhaiensis TaxID=375761 RepID=UPI001CD798AA|nr:metallophosphoesterase [Pseudooceanicola nanhaiensis]MCA0920231.1 metallophosphoesterase [Pseudooceanicola nanhaiensis]
MSEFSFRWLHISDLHFGMKGQAPLWSNLKHHLYDDLALLHKQSGPWDLLVFSGDIVQSGNPAEFEGATEALLELYGKLAELGCHPKFIAVPGNHDLVRPAAKGMEVMLLGQWHTNKTVRDEFLNNPDSHYRKVINNAFENYRLWQAGLAATGIPVLDVVHGYLPGDQVARVEVNGHQVGIVGLNSTWLQLTHEAKAGDLHIDHSQLSSMLPEAEGWCRANDFNILVTHQPVDWLGAESKAKWNAEIAAPGRFDIHLFGHMHEPEHSSLSVMGSTPKTIFQSPSLFGLEYLPDNSTRRIHGYSAGELAVTASGRKLRIWPRTFMVSRGGQGKMAPDHNFHLPDNISTSLTLQTKKVERSADSAAPVAMSQSPAVPKPKIFAATSTSEPQALVARFGHHLLPSGPHAHVRTVEQAAARHALGKRGLWIVADWGLSSDEFVSSILEGASMADKSIVRLDLSEIPLSGEDLEQEIEAKIGIKIQELSEELAQSNYVLLLDDISLGDRPQGALPREKGLEDLARVVLDYCPSLVIIMRTRSNPANEQFGKVEIRALDEADLKTYILHHSNGGQNLAEPPVVSQVYDLTGGVPDQVDRILKSLKVVTLSELIAGHQEGADPSIATRSPTLVRAVEELGNAEDPMLQRARSMLQVLSTFPHGAQFEHIKRFNGVHGFYPDNATELMQRALITATTLPGLEPQSVVETRRILSVPRAVREVVRANMSDELLERHDRRAAELYFGSNWRAGSTSWPPERKYSSPKCSHHEITNASAILLRLLKISLQDESKDETIALMHLAVAYSSALLTGSHYYGAAAFCSAFLHTAPTNVAYDTVQRITLNYGKALRIGGERQKSIEILEGLDLEKLGRSDRESLLLELALAYQSHDTSKAIDFAQRLLKASKARSKKIQAQSIIVGAEPDGEQRTSKLMALEREARNKKYYTVANNLAILLAKESKDDGIAEQYLSSVINTKGSSDNIYNEARAAVDFAERALKIGDSISELDHSKLIAAYQYLFIQRIPSLFDRCHRILWKSFAKRGEVDNLYALFRHSSFIWRIRGLMTNEKRYIENLTRIASKDAVSVSDNRDRSYFNARLEAAGLPRIV